MIDKKAEILIDASKKIYAYITDIISGLYENAFSGDLKWSKTEVLQDFDAYLQAVLTSVALSDGQLSQGEAELIGSICKYGTLFDGIDIKLFANCNYEMRSRLQKISEDALKKLPIACWLSGVVDIKHDRRITKAIMDSIIKIGYNLCAIKGSSDIEVIKKSIKSITDFIISKSIKIN